MNNNEKIVLNQKDKTIQQALKHTIDIISEHGVEAVTTKLISNRMNMSTGILHHHFGTKDNIIYQAYVYFIEDIRNKVSDQLKKNVSPEQHLVAFGAMHFHKSHTSSSGSNLWLSFWYRSNKDKRVSRLLRIFHLRFINNMVVLFKIISPSKGWARQSAYSYFSIIQGYWVSFMVTKINMDTSEIPLILETELKKIISSATQNKSTKLVK